MSRLIDNYITARLLSSEYKEELPHATSAAVGVADHRRVTTVGGVAVEAPEEIDAQIWALQEKKRLVRLFMRAHNPVGRLH